MLTFLNDSVRSEGYNTFFGIQVGLQLTKIRRWKLQISSFKFTPYLSQNCPNGMTKNQRGDPWVKKICFPKKFTELDGNIFKTQLKYCIVPFTPMGSFLGSQYEASNVSLSFKIRHLLGWIIQLRPRLKQRNSLTYDLDQRWYNITYHHTNIHYIPQ